MEGTWDSQSSKAGRHLVALGSDYLITNTEIFLNFSNGCCHTDATFVAFSIAFNLFNRL